MRCHKCNQESIKIHNDQVKIGESPVFIKCDICGLYIRCGEDSELLCDLFIYNENLEEAEKLGKEAMLGDKKIGDNPYTVANDQIMLNKRWEIGYNREKESYEFSALSLSAKKIEEQLRTELRVTQEEKEVLVNRFERFNSASYKYIESFCFSLKDRTILGMILKKDIISFLDDLYSVDINFIGVLRMSQQQSFGSKVAPVAVGFGAWYIMMWIVNFFPAFIISFTLQRIFFGIDGGAGADVFCILAMIIGTFVILVLQAAKQWFIVLVIYLLTLWPFLYILGHIWSCEDDSAIYPLPLDLWPLW